MQKEQALYKGGFLDLPNPTGPSSSLHRQSVWRPWKRNDEVTKNKNARPVRPEGNGTWEEKMFDMTLLIGKIQRSPVDMVNIPLFTRFSTAQLSWCRISSNNSMWKKRDMQKNPGWSWLFDLLQRMKSLPALVGSATFINDVGNCLFTKQWFHFWLTT